MFSHLISFFNHRPSRAVGAVFMAMGTLFGNWATLIPYIKTKFVLDDGELGLLLLSMPIGSLIANPLTGALIHKFGMQRMTLAGLLFMSLAYIIPILSPWLWAVSAGIILSGIGIALTNISMNTCAATIERSLERHIMATVHGLFSLGLMVGALTASFFIGLQAPALIQTVFISLFMIILSYFLKPTLLTIKDDHIDEPSDNKAKFIWPSGALLLMIFISLCTNLTEGAMADWTAVYLKDIVNAPAVFWGWGLACYSSCMAAGRFTGDFIIPKYGAKNVLKIGGLLSAFGIALAVSFPYTWLTIVAFGFVGAGVSCGAPILYGGAARLPGLAKGVGLATLNTFSLLGFLCGPVVIGAISNALNLRIALALVGILGLIWMVLSGKLKL